jgi:tetratricopeptide (TPR) repeat protein
LLADEGWTPDAHRRAVEHFERAIALQPDYAEAWAALAQMHVSDALFYRVTPREALALARPAAERALALDEGSAEAHVAMASVAFSLEWDFVAAERHLRQAVSLDPSSAVAHKGLMYFYACLGRGGEALAAVERAVALDPLSPDTLLMAAWAPYYAGDYQRSLEAVARAFELAPGQAAPLHMMAAWSHHALGQAAEAAAACDRALAVLPNDQIVLATCGGPLAAVGRVSEADGIFLRLLAQRAAGILDPYNLGVYWAFRDDAARAAEWFEVAIRERSPNVVGLRGDTVRIADDPRISAQLARVGF